MLVAAQRSLFFNSMLVLMSLGWTFLGLAAFAFIASELLNIMSGSRLRQIYGGLLGTGIASALTFSRGSQPIKALMCSITQSLPGSGLLARCREILTGALKQAYSVLFQTADVLFCIGAPLLAFTAGVGWWLIEDIDGPMLLFYIGLIIVISIAGIYNNLVRMLPLGYFNGCWLIDNSKLSYPFEAPLRVHETVELMC